jgi:hypothetical protein
VYFFTEEAVVLEVNVTIVIMLQLNGATTLVALIATIPLGEQVIVPS